MVQEYLTCYKTFNACDVLKKGQWHLRFFLLWIIVQWKWHIFLINKVESIGQNFIWSICCNKIFCTELSKHQFTAKPWTDDTMWKLCKRRHNKFEVNPWEHLYKCFVLFYNMVLKMYILKKKMSSKSYMRSSILSLFILLWVIILFRKHEYHNKMKSKQQKISFKDKM